MSFGSSRACCDSCERAPAVVFCQADGAFLCQQCDVSVHSVNKVAMRHERIPVESAPGPAKKVLCDHCQGGAASVYCRMDAAYLCPNCDEQIHGANKLAARHERHSLANGPPPPSSPTMAPLSSPAGSPAVRQNSPQSFTGAASSDKDGTAIFAGDDGTATSSATFDDHLGVLEDFGGSLEPLLEGKHYNGPPLSMSSDSISMQIDVKPDVMIKQEPFTGDFPSPLASAGSMLKGGTRSTNRGMTRSHSMFGMDQMGGSSGNGGPSPMGMPPGAAAAQRYMQLQRYRQKRAHRVALAVAGTKKIRYECRKTLADNRPRVKGRFAKVHGPNGVGTDSIPNRGRVAPTPPPSSAPGKAGKGAAGRSSAAAAGGDGGAEEREGSKSPGRSGSGSGSGSDDTFEERTKLGGPVDSMARVEIRRDPEMTVPSLDVGDDADSCLQQWWLEDEGGRDDTTEMLKRSFSDTNLLHLDLKVPSAMR